MLIPEIDDRTRLTCDVLVIGGGIAGTIAALTAAEAGADVLLLDSIGFGDEHRAAARRTAGLPVLQASDLVARVTGACLLNGV